MKHLLVVCILLTTFISCKKNTLTLSCSKEINDWANSVIAYYELAPREQIIQLPISRQRAIFRGLSSKRKVSLWNDKLSLILYDETYTEEQCADFSVLIKQLDATVFDDEVCQKAFNEYAELWETSMKDKYGWDENVLFMLAYTWMTEE